MHTATIRRPLAILLLLVLVSAVALHAGTFVAFGPKDYVRGTGSPVTMTDTFTVLSPSTQYVLKAYNGGLTNSPTELVSSSVVTLNGVQVLGPNNFNQNVTEVDVPVTLQSANALTVQVRGSPGGVLTIQIVGVDNDPPVVKATASPAPNAAGWNNTSVTVTFTCSDATSGVASCPPPQTVTAEGANQVISGTATDNAGNTASASVALNIATTPPRITASALPAANASGWNNSNATVSFACAATTAPISTCTPAQTVSTDGAGQAISGTATDLAGNKATASATINLDKTPPTITATPSPAPNSQGINTTNVTVTFTCNDATSGVASCPAPQTVTTAGANQVISGTATDNAGNTATASVTLDIVKNSPPVITASVSPLPNAAGWNNSPVTVTFNCSEVAGTVSSCTSPITVSAEGAKQVVTGTAVDQSGQTATTSVTLNLDLTPPQVTGSANPAPNSAGWNNANVAVSFQCSDSLSGVASCPPPIPVTSEGTAIVTSQPATDIAGNSATASVAVKVDRTPPTVTIVSPATGSNAFSSQATISGTVSDSLSGVSSVTCNGLAAQLNISVFNCSATLGSGANTISVVATDAAGNSASATSSVSLIPAPVVTITSPANLSYTNVSPVTVRGTVDNSSDSVTVNGVAAFPSGGTFSVQVPLNEGINTLTALAANPGGNQATASINVTLDTTPPHLTIDSPADKSITTNSTVTVSGTVNDVVVGTVNDQNAQVTVNGTAAQVANRSYSLANVSLALGPNVIQAVARDQAGNATTASITITRVSPAQPPAAAIGQSAVVNSLNIISGNNQSATIGGQLTSPVVVSLTNPSGTPVPNQPVVFKVTGNDGVVTTSTSTGAAATVYTDSNGLAQVSWTLGYRSGVGVNRLEASSAVAFDVADFSAVGMPGGAALIVVDSGDNQTGIAGQQLTFPLAVVVTDSGHNRIAGVPVTFSALSGGGSLNGAPSQVITTDSDGRALAVFALGPAAGSNIAKADFPGDAGSAVAFTATAKLAGDPSQTTISGEVLDNTNNPIPNVTIRLYQTNQGSNNNLPLQIGTPVQTDVQGHFVIPNAPYGYFKLMADGTTAGGGTTSYPTLEYDIVTIAGQENTVGMPIYLPVLNPSNQACVDATHGGTVTLPQAPGFSLTIAPGSATFPGGSRQGCVSVSTVHGDKVPMAPGFGQQPRFIVTIQPVGTVFNPPAAMTLPNVDGLAPRAKTEMYSYDHDLSMFVAIGTATVSDDGSVIASDPGTGVLKAGWHCGGDPNAAGHVADCPACNICNGVSCVPNPNAAPCTDPSNLMLDLGPSSVLPVHVLFDVSCNGACTTADGTCAPNGSGFSNLLIQTAITDALFKVFDETCIGDALRTRMQNNLRSLPGIFIQCNPDPGDCDSPNPQNCECAHSENSHDPDDPDELTVTNVININTIAVKGGRCPSLESTFLHEMVHAFGQEAGSPSGDWHNGINIDNFKAIDCRDKVFGCQESCYPGSTSVYGGIGNAQVCTNPADPSQHQDGCNGQCRAVTNQKLCLVDSSCATGLNCNGVCAGPADFFCTTN